MNFTLKSMVSNLSFIDILVSFLLLCSFQPFFVWSNGILFSLVNFLLVLFLFPSIKVDKNNISVLVLLFLLYTWVCIRGGFTFIGSLSNYCLLVFICLSPQKFDRVFIYFKNTFAIVIGISLIIYILVVIIGVELPSFEIEPLNREKNDVVYHCYYFLITFEKYGILLPRFCGLFDEPGVIGTICGCLLVADRFNLKDKYNIIIFLAGVLSLSLFFFVTAFAYILVFSKVRAKIAIILIAAVLLFFFADNEFLDLYLWDRFDFSDGKIAGDNRKMGISPTWYKSFQQSSSYYWGLGNNAHSIYNAGGCSYSDLIIDYGVLFFILYVVSFSAYAFNRLKNFKLWLAFLLAFGGVIYQRPFITFIGYFFLMIAPIYTLGTLAGQKNMEYKVNGIKE